MVARVASFGGVDADEAERTMDQAVSIVRPMIEEVSGIGACSSSATRRRASGPSWGGPSRSEARPAASRCVGFKQAEDVHALGACDLETRKEHEIEVSGGRT